MPLDAICLSGLTRELTGKLTGAKIDKIQQPDADRSAEYEKFYQLYVEIYPALKAQFAKLAQL